MSRWESWSLNLLTFLVTASGIAYYWMKYVLQTDDPFSLINHPWQPAMLKIHILAAPFLILLAGIMVNSHIRKSLQNSTNGRNRKSGILTALCFPVMVISGYLLEVTTSQAISRILLYVHLGSGLLFGGTYALHLVLKFFPIRCASKLTERVRLVA